MEPLGQKLQRARLAKKITLEEASRVTKIRPARIQEIEAEDFSSFSSLAYAKGFLLIYGKFLDVDVTPYLDAFETSREVSVDGYSYLQDAPNTSPPPMVRRQAAKRPALLPLIIAVGVLVLGLYMVKLLLNIQRITPSHPAEPVASAVASVTPQPSASPTPEIVAPRALPVESPPPSEALVTVAPESSPEAPVPTTTEPEVRRRLAGASGGFGDAQGFPAAPCQSRADHSAAQNVFAGNGRQSGATGVRWLAGSFRPAAFLPRATGRR